MKLRNILSALLISICALGITAADNPQYRMNLIYEVEGPVREIKMKSSGDFTKVFNRILGSATKFKENGKLNRELMSYDAEGYPIGFGMNFDDDSKTLKIRYNDARRIAGYDFESTEPGNAAKFTVDMTYDGKRVASTRLQGDGVCVEFVYSAEEYDDQGNWLSRRVKETVESQNPENNSTKEYTEIREIKYY